VVAGERRASVRLVAGSDYPNAALAAGSGLLEELRALTHAGLSPFTALTAATVTAGRALDQNEGVMAAGRWFSRPELDRRAPRRTTPATCSTH
jgi:hypothetical protein